MKSRAVVYSATADADLTRILRWLSEEASPVAAFSVVEDMQDFIDRLDLASMRGTARDDLAPGLRVVGHKRAMIVFAVGDDEVLIIRIFYGGEDWQGALQR